jgi:hypothetical protein
VLEYTIFSFVYFNVPPNEKLYSDIGSNFSQNFWDSCRPAFLMDKTPLKKRIILCIGTRRYKHVFEGDSKKKLAGKQQKRMDCQEKENSRTILSIDSEKKKTNAGKVAEKCLPITLSGSNLTLWRRATHIWAVPHS